ncbi:MAG: hypothetical protein GY945_13765 [Rhodobacteraceae bacterium]|nr:hypothetical protein [Paracoccaceae bacterium]
MIVNSVELSQTRFEADTSRHKASVTLNMIGASGEGFNISFSCHTTQPEECPSTLVLYGLIKHATDQARRMPFLRGPDNAFKLDLEKVRITAA